MSTSHPETEQLPPPEASVGATENSATETGGVIPPAEHSTAAVQQSPVTHENFPASSWLHRVLPHRRPDQVLAGTARVFDSPGLRENPEVGIGGLPEFCKMAAQTLWLHWLMTVRVFVGSSTKKGL